MILETKIFQETIQPNIKISSIKWMIFTKEETMESLQLILMLSKPCSKSVTKMVSRLVNIK